MALGGGEGQRGGGRWSCTCSTTMAAAAQRLRKRLTPQGHGGRAPGAGLRVPGLHPLHMDQVRGRWSVPVGPVSAWGGLWPGPLHVPWNAFTGERGGGGAGRQAAGPPPQYAPPAPPELSRNVPRPACGSVGPCSICPCLSWQMLVASLDKRHTHERRTCGGTGSRCRRRNPRGPVLSSHAGDVGEFCGA